MLREEYENWEMRFLAPYAMKAVESRGRVYNETKHPYRTDFQRDRDRIVHSTAFRRLEYKTQVFVNHEGDHYRTRLTHSLEVAIIARSIARNLRLNEDLTESIALAHDMGHTPFGHSGEEALNELLKDNGGFEHNRQCIRVVDLLEKRYPNFPGLNLTYELREGIFKHHSHYDQPDLPVEFADGPSPSLECQIVNVADEVAYNCHDVDDGLSSGVLIPAQLDSVRLWRDHVHRVAREFPGADEQMLRHIMVRYLINFLVTDLTLQSEKNIAQFAPSQADDVRRNHSALVTFSEDAARLNGELKLFLYLNMYKHKKMVAMADQARTIVTRLFNSFMADSTLLPAHFQSKIGAEAKHTVVADYIAGMTDRFAAAEYEKLTGNGTIS